MKILKMTALVLGAIILALFGYANLRVRSEGEKQKPVALTSFRLKGNLDESALDALEKNIKTTPGVRACAISAKHATATMIYYKDVISESKLSSMLINNSISDVSKRDLAASGGGCPVHKVGASFERLISALDVGTYSLIKTNLKKSHENKCIKKPCSFVPDGCAHNSSGL